MDREQKPYIPEMRLTDYMYQEKKDEDLPALKTALTHRYNDSKTTYKSAGEDWLQPPETKTENTRINRTEISRKQKW